MSTPDKPGDPALAFARQFREKRGKWPDQADLAQAGKPLPDAVRDTRLVSAPGESGVWRFADLSADERVELFRQRNQNRLRQERARIVRPT